MAVRDSKTALAAALCVCSGALAQLANAQPAPEPDTVLNRERDGVDPLGARLGSFRIFPEIGLEVMQDDNVLAEPVAPESDSAYVLRPSLTLRSDWSRNSLSAGVDGAMFRYSELPGEDHDDSAAFLSGRWDTANAGFFYADLDMNIEHEGRDSVDDDRALERARFGDDRLTLGFQIAPGRMLYQIEVDSREIDFDDVVGLGGKINNDDRDRDQNVKRLRVAFEVSPGYSVFLQGIDTETDYVFRFDDNGFERSSKGDAVHAGLTLNIADLVFGDIFVGRKSHNYDDPRFSDIGGRSFGIDVSWNVTGLTTFTFEGRQEVAATTLQDAAGIDETRFGVRADHELLQNLILSLEWGKRTEDYSGIRRTDKNHTASFGARYLMNRKLEVDFRYTHRERDSNVNTDRVFSRNVLSVQFTGQF